MTHRTFTAAEVERHALAAFTAWCGNLTVEHTRDLWEKDKTHLPETYAGWMRVARAAITETCRLLSIEARFEE